MNQNERSLFQSCKVGDLAKVQQLVEKEDVQLNIRDKWDSTPLYYACLCGHISLVEYLLENGARCEANTFDGERCLYGALTDQIRSVLKNFKITATSLDQFDLHLERLYELSPYSDIVFEIKGRVLKAHKFILSARSEYFRAKFEDKWKKRTWIIGEHDELVPEAFDSILRYIYTVVNKNLNVPSRSETGLMIEKNDVKLTEFNCDDKLADEQAPINETDIFLIGKFGVDCKLSTTITIQTQDDISHDFKKIAYFCLPNELRKTCSFESKDDLTRLIDLTHDLCFNLEYEYKFNVHKAFIAERCDYFKAFLNDPFNEIQNLDGNMNSREISQINLKEISKEVLVEIIFFIYSNNFSREKLDENTLYDVLLVADLYLLPSLKRKCASEMIAHHLNKENLFDLLKISRLYELKKLEFACIAYLAAYLHDFEHSEELREFIKQDAMSLKMRQETDTIDIIDDLRYAINETISFPLAIPEQSISSKPISRLINRDNKLYLIEKILDELNLQC